MALKKIESITFRTDKDLKAALLKISEEKKWTLSQLSEEMRLAVHLVYFEQLSAEEAGKVMK